MPEVVVGLSLLLLMVGAQNVFGWPERGMFTIILGHTLLGMAYGMVVVQSRLLEVNRSLEEAAMDLGARPHEVFFLVTLPNIAQGILAAFLLSFTLSFDDVVISEFLSGPGVNSLPQVIFGYARRGINPTIYAAATLLIATVTIAIVAYSIWVARQTRQRERDIAAASRGAAAAPARTA
jgi:putrescine transport system permease protein